MRMLFTGIGPLRLLYFSLAPSEFQLSVRLDMRDRCIFPIMILA